MRATAHFHDALGLAAPQIGVTARIFVMRRPKQMLADRGLRPRTTSFEVCMNPEVLRSTDRESLSPEACLSLPGYDAFVRRKHVITAQWVDEHGTKRKETLRGLPAAVFQHELDHLDGVLLVDREITDVANTAAATEAEQRYDDELDRHYPRAARRAPAPSAQVPVDRV
jgi:peptide deformylase